MEQKKLAIIATKGTLDWAYPPFILASTAAALGYETQVFFTFYGLQLLKKGFRVRGTLRSPSRETALRETFARHVDAGDRAELTFDVLPGKVFRGEVRRTGYGVQVSSNALGTLPTIENQRNWLRDAQRFPVAVDFERGGLDPADLRVGSQASVIVYSGDNWLLNLLGKIYIRAAALLSYAY
ncbi:MAG: DsrE/DsrF/DrsH-like family protein [Gammaproteobacteria bacterium]